MNRRDLLVTLAGTGALSLGGCASPPQPSTELTDAEITRLTMALTGLVLKPGDAPNVRQALTMLRFKGAVDPSVQPATTFDPEVDGE